MKYWLSLLCLPLLASCGGSDTSAVFDISSTPLHYGTVANFAFSGSVVGNQGLKADIPNCVSQVTLVSTSTQLGIRCILTVSGDIPVKVLDGAGTVVYTKTFNVPAPQVTFSTSKGDIVAELNPNATPVTVNNFLRYVQSGFYANTLFHRVIPKFVIQGGGFVSGLTPQTGEQAAIALETNKGLSNLRGTLAMARTDEPNSATSQFYFNLADNPTLDYQNATNPGYAVFGKIVQGLDVMDAIGGVPTSVQQGQPNVPVDEVVVKSVTRTQ